MAHEKPAVLTWTVCRPVVGGIPWQATHDGVVVAIVVGTVVGGTVVVAVVVVDVAGVVVGTVVAGTVVVGGTVVVPVVVVDVAGVVVGTVVGVVVGAVVGAPGFGFGSPTFQLRLETGKLTNPLDATVKLPRSSYVEPVTV